MSRLGAIPALDAYQLRLPTFEGPLDVLLRLIEREQLDISEVSLLLVLDQFLAFMHAMDAPPPSVVAEFAAVAGRLSVLKSRALLPRPIKATEELDEVDLVRQLEEYRALKHAARLLADQQRQDESGFPRGEAVATPEPDPPRLQRQKPVAIVQAVSRWMTRMPERPVPIAPVRVVTLREMVSRIFSELQRDRSTTFDVIRTQCGSRQDLAVAFLAVLTLVRRQAITARQDGLFAPITLTRTSLIPEGTHMAATVWADDIDEPARLQA